MTENEKQTNKERLKEITDSIEKGIQELFESDKYAQYLRTMSRFHRYSVNNQMLIYMQKPEATLVAGFNKWRDQFERNVRKGEKGIKIIAPTPFKKKIEEQKLDPDTKQPMLDADGKVIMEEKEIKIPLFKPVTVFDVSQTEGKPLPQLASDLSGDVQNYEVFMEALRRSSPVPIDIKPIRDGSDGFFSLDDQKITLREGMSEVQTISAALHEIAHAKLHNNKTSDADKTNIESAQRKDRNTEEVEAESISFAVCAYYGIATGENSFGYIADWSKGKELKELRASMETINKASSELITDIDRNYAEILREREAEITAEEEPAVQTPSNCCLPDPSATIEGMNAYGYTDQGMLPLSKERALELFEHDVTIYMLYDDNTEGMVFEVDDIQLFSGCFGVTREDWELAQNKVPPMSEETICKKREKAFLESKVDTFAIYQLKRDDATADLRFMGTDWLDKKGIDPKKENYALVYTGALTYRGAQSEKLEDIYRTFNTDRPQDFTGHSLSVSDIVALKQNGVVSYHYVDRVGYKELPNFAKSENYLKNAEMLMEDDYGMIDGIVNNGPKQPAQNQPKRQEEVKNKKPSVLAQLRKYQEEDRRGTTMHRSAERNFD